MCNWKSWIWPGLITTAVLTALTGWFLSGPVEQDLVSRAGEALNGTQPWATVSFDGRDATITGVAESDTQQTDAAKIALGTYGMRILDNLVSLPSKADPFVLKLVKDESGVTLSGNYTSTESRAVIIATAEKAMPGIAIKDEMTLAVGKPEGFDALAAFGIGQLTDLTSGEVSLSNMDYTIKGTPLDIATYEKVADAATQLPAGAMLKAADLAVPALSGPYEFSAAIDGNAVNLNGYAPSLEAKSAIEADAKAAFPDKSVNNLLKLAVGAPSNFAELVKFGFGQMATLGNGSMSLADANYSIKGVPADTATFDAMMKSLKDNLPAGATLAMADFVKPEEPAPVVVAPYVWSAIAAPDGVKIEGSVPSAESAAAALDLAKRRFVKAEVTDAQTILDGAPEGFSEVQILSLKALSYLKEGKAAHSDKSVNITGVAASEAIKVLVIKNATAALPRDYALTTSITVAEAAPEPAPAAIIAAPSCLVDVAALLQVNQISFQTSKSEIEAISAPLIGQIAAALAICPNVRVEIAGHTDSDGNDLDNTRLSQDRSDAVRNALVAAGIPLARIDAKGYGETEPIAENDTNENKAKNRRTEFRAVQ